VKWLGGIALALIALTAVALRWVGLSRESLWFDEGMTWWLASLPPGELLRVIKGDVAAPLHYVLLHAWRAIFGDTDIAMRAFSALMATLTLVPFYLIVRRVIQSTIARLIACGLMAISLMQVHYAHEARYYALLALVSITALACVPFMTEHRNRAAMAVFVLASAAGMYTHNVMAFYLIGLYAAWLLWPGERPMKQRLADMTVAGLSLVLIYLPWVPVVLQQMKWMAGTFWAERPEAFHLGLAGCAITGVDLYYVPGTFWSITGVTPPQPLIATVVALCLIGAIAMASRSRAMLALAGFAIGPVVLVFAYSLVRQPIFLERLFIASSAVTPILLAMTLDRVRPIPVRSAGGIVVSVVGVLMLLSTVPMLASERKEDWRGAYAAVAELPASDRRLIVFVANEGEMPFWYYAAHAPSRAAEPRTGVPQGFLDLDPPKTIERVMTDGDLLKLSGQMMSGKWDEIVLVLSHERYADPEGRTVRFLRSQWRVAEVRNLRHVSVMRFVALR
jgi:hypothetical protein